ncbi:MAG: NADH-quinone oxidoreductase subunit N [Gammaproteobacteria bacterium]|nr:NADH-quinone oxidoreductase subunit N [Gammaproteobacteria bacterium]
MSDQQLLAILPHILLTTVILIQMMVIAFARNLRTTVAISVIALILTGLAFIPVYSLIPIMVTPLIVLDGYAIYYSGLILMSSTAVTLMAYDYFKDRGEKQDEFFMLLLFATLGALILVCSSHFASMILGLELLGVSIYTMISYPHKGLLTLEAALKYLILSGVSSTFILFGAALIYAVGGKLGFAELASVALETRDSGEIFLTAGSALIFAGIMFKLSVTPFHMWTPDVYEGAPAPVTAFVATVSKGAIFAITLRLFTSSNLIEVPSILTGLSVVAILSMLVGNLLALRQDNVKRILAYSSIAHLGYLMVAFIAAGMIGGKVLAIEASSYFLFAYFITTLGAFGVVTIVSLPNTEADAGDISNYEGLFWRRPMLAIMFTLTLLSLAGIPLTVGFIGKFYIFTAGVTTTLWLLLSVVIIGSGIGIFYYLRIIFAMTKRTETDVTKIEIPIAGGWVMASVTAAILFFGIYPTPIVNLINNLVLSIT